MVIFNKISLIKISLINLLKNKLFYILVQPTQVKHTLLFRLSLMIYKVFILLHSDCFHGKFIKN